MVDDWKSPLRVTKGSNLETSWSLGVSLITAKRGGEHMTRDVPALSKCLSQGTSMIPHIDQVRQATSRALKKGNPGRLLKRMGQYFKDKGLVHLPYMPLYRPDVQPIEQL